MNYALNTTASRKAEGNGMMSAIKAFMPLLKDEKKKMLIAFAAIIINATMNLLAPIVVGFTIDTYIQSKNYDGVMQFSGLLFIMYAVSLVASYIQTKTMGGVGQRTLFNLRNAVFNKLQELPVAFFNQNKAGDLISRINNDTDKLNQFFSQALLQFVNNSFMIIGAGIFILYLNVRLGGATLLPAEALLIFTVAISGYVKRKNALSLESTGSMSSEIQESLNNFKVIVAFNRRDYFRKKFNEANEQNYKAAMQAGIVNSVFLLPLYGLVSAAAQLIVLACGLYLISVGQFSVGLLITFFTFVSRFYDPLRHIAALWAQFQIAIAAWDRITDILSMDTDLVVLPESKAVHHDTHTKFSKSLLEFKNVHFGYTEGQEILHNVNLTLDHGKTYALVGPTGGGKTTTASLMARLYDPVEGTVFLNNKDIRSYKPSERTQKIGFILQEPFLFTGTVKDNILYGNEEHKNYTTEQLQKILEKEELHDLVARFEKGLDTEVSGSGETISLGQKQLIAFIRAVLRKPELLILDEATANIDTVTEQLLEGILQKLPKTTTRVIIAHRLNTIENADEIYFVNSGEITLAGSFDHALEMLMHGKRSS
jgi:ATP-binding cassette subfamily B protein